MDNNYNYANTNFWDTMGKSLDLKFNGIMDTLNTKIKKVEAKVETIANLEYEKSLIETDIVTFIRNDMCYSSFNIFGVPASDLLYKTWWWVNHRDDEDYVKTLGSEKKEAYEDATNYILWHIENQILRKDTNFKLIKVVQGYHEQLFCFNYNYNEVDLEIEIPNFEMADKYNYYKYIHPYAVRYKSSDSCWDLICCEANWKDINTKLVAWLKEKGIYKEPNTTKE